MELGIGSTLDYSRASVYVYRHEEVLRMGKFKHNLAMYLSGTNYNKAVPLFETKF